MARYKAILPVFYAATLFGGSLFERIRELPSAYVGKTYSAVLQANGPGSCSIVGMDWQVAAGDLPPGVTLAGSRLKGTPRTAGSWEIALRASSACSETIVPVRILGAEPQDARKTDVSSPQLAAL